MFCNSLQAGWCFNIDAGYMFGFFLMTLGQVLVCYKHNQDQTQFSLALMLQVVWVKIAKAEPQFSDLSSSTIMDLVMPEQQVQAVLPSEDSFWRRIPQIRQLC